MRRTDPFFILAKRRRSYLTIQNSASGTCWSRHFAREFNKKPTAEEKTL